MGKRDNESVPFWFIMFRLSGFVVFHAIVYVFGRKIWKWLKDNEKRKPKASILPESFRLTSPCENLFERDDFSEAEVSSADEEIKFIDAVDKFCKTGTKIHKSPKCIKYMKAIQRKVEERLTSNKIPPTSDANVHAKNTKNWKL